MKMTPQEYEERRQRRIERLRQRAERLNKEAVQRYQTAHNMAEAIPFGQPILVGHHSEKRDRAYRGRIESSFRKSFELNNEAEAVQRRAEAAERNRAIFTDDPAAAEKLEIKLEQLEQRQTLMKATNKLVKKGDHEGLLDLGFTETQVAKLFTPDVMGALGFPTYAITNNGANIRRIKQRIEHLRAHAEDQASEIVIGSVKIVDNTDENRVQIFFPGKPPAELRAKLKSRGFRWAPSVGAWQRQRSTYALDLAKQLAGEAQ